MKKYLFVLYAGLTFGLAQGQEIKDALRYAQDNLSGTARFRAMEGAFGAVGGDLSSINVNPAGSAVFANNQVTVTFGSFNTHNNSNYYGTSTSATNNNFELNQTGGVFVFKNPYNDWKKFTFAVNYEKANIYDNSTFSAGVNPTNSVDGYFLSYANGVPLNLIRDSYYSQLDHGPQQAFLGYQAYIINPVNNNDSNTAYDSNVTPGGKYYQENSISSGGYNGKLSFNFATSYKDKFYFGANLNSHFTNYYESTNFYESNRNPLTSDYTVTKLNFSNNLHTYGSGFSFQLGAIAKITHELRLGLAYQSPTWYHLNDELSQNISAVRANNNDTKPADVVNPSVVNYYAPYQLQTPGKVTGSFAYIFGRNGLLSIDYGLKNYGNTKFSPGSDPYFRSVNSQMNTILAFTNEVRIGAEYKIKALSLRGGYRYEQSPYKNAQTIGDLNSFSGGLGYNFGAFKLDCAYTHTEKSSQQAFFNQGFTDGARINSLSNNFITTLVFDF